MADFTSEELGIQTGAKGPNFTSSELTAPRPKSVFERVGQAYKSVIDPMTKSAALAIEHGGGPFSTLAEKLGITKPIPKDAEPGGFSKFAAGMVLPQTPTQLMLMGLMKPLAAVGEGVSHTAPVIKQLLNPLERNIAKSGPIMKAIKGGAARMGIAGGAGAGTSALTGESPITGLVEGAVSQGIGEIARNVGVLSRADEIPRSAEGLLRTKNRFSPPVDISTPQPGNWGRAIADDFPPLKRFIDNIRNTPRNRGGNPDYKFDISELLGLKSGMRGNRITVSSEMAQQMGEEIYRPFQTILDLLKPHATFDFPYLRPGKFGRLGLANEPTISEILPGIDLKILGERAGGLTPKKALDTIQQLKDAAFNPESEGSIRHAAKKLATMMENDFITQLSTIHPSIPALYKKTLSEYTQLKSLQFLISKYGNRILPTASEGRVGLDPVEWGTALRDISWKFPESKWPRLNNAVTFGGLELGGGATLRKSLGDTLRTYAEMLPGLRGGVTVLRPHDRMVFPTPPTPMRVWPRPLIPAVMSGVQATSPDQQLPFINR